MVRWNDDGDYTDEEGRRALDSDSWIDGDGGGTFRIVASGYANVRAGAAASDGAGALRVIQDGIPYAAGDCAPF